MEINNSTLDEFETLNEQFDPDVDNYSGKNKYFIRLYGNELVGLLTIFPVGRQKGEEILSGDITSIKTTLKVKEIIVTRFSAEGRKSRRFNV